MSDEVSESTLIAGFIQWAYKNHIRIEMCTYDEIYEYICRYLRAAG